MGALANDASAAFWFAIAALPICLYVAYTDCRMMKITNQAVMALVVVFALVGIFTLPFPEYLWRWSHLALMLLLGILLNAGGVMGAGDAKFIAGAAPFVALPDLPFVMVLLGACLLAAFATHRLAKHTPLRQLAPDWESWTRAKFPLGLALGPTLAIYLILGARYGAAA